VQGIKMKLSRVEQFNQKVWEAQFERSLRCREKFYQEIRERNKLSQTERIARNVGLGLEKGRNVDIDC
jgi:hypothetical protein